MERSQRKRLESAEPLSNELLLVVVIRRQEFEGLGKEGRRPLVNVHLKSLCLLPLVSRSSTYQESCALGVLELRTSDHLTEI